MTASFFIVTSELNVLVLSDYIWHSITVENITYYYSNIQFLALVIKEVYRKEIRFLDLCLLYYISPWFHPYHFHSIFCWWKCRYIGSCYVYEGYLNSKQANVLSKLTKIWKRQISVTNPTLGVFSSDLEVVVLRNCGSVLKQIKNKIKFQRKSSLWLFLQGVDCSPQTLVLSWTPLPWSSSEFCIARSSCHHHFQSLPKWCLKIYHIQWPLKWLLSTV